MRIKVNIFIDTGITRVLREVKTDCMKYYVNNSKYVVYLYCSTAIAHPPL